MKRHSGQPVISHEDERLLGWITRRNALGTSVRRVDSSGESVEHGAIAAPLATQPPAATAADANPELRRT